MQQARRTPHSRRPGAPHPHPLGDGAFRQAPIDESTSPRRKSCVLARQTHLNTNTPQKTKGSPCCDDDDLVPCFASELEKEVAELEEEARR